MKDKLKGKPRSVNITEEQIDWIDRTGMNLSLEVRKMIDDKMREKKTKEKKK